MTPPVHRNERHPGLRHHRRHVRVGQTTGNVVDDPRAGLDPRGCDCCAHGVDRRVDPFSAQSLEHREDAGRLFVGTGAQSAGSSGLATDIDDVRPLLNQLQPTGDCLLDGRPLPAVAEGIGGDVEHPHDHRHRLTTGQPAPNSSLRREWRRPAVDRAPPR